MTPLPVRAAVERSPRDRPQNVLLAITPPAVASFDYYPVSFVGGLEYRALSVWSTPWWLAKGNPFAVSFSSAFSSAFNKGAAS